MTVTFESIWDFPIACYLFLAGLGAGAFLATCVIDWKNPEASRMRRAGLIIAPVAVAIGLVLLMVDARGGLYNPLRFALLLNNPGSVMSWGVVFLAVFMVVSIAALVLDLLHHRLPVALKVVGCVTAVAVGIYTGVLLGVVRAFPLWNNAVLPLLFLVSALSAGAAAVMLYGRLAARAEVEQLGFVEKLTVPLPYIEAVLLILLLAFVAGNGAAGAQSTLNLTAGSWALCFWVGIVALGLVVPAVVEGISLYRERRRPASPVASGVLAASNASVLVGGICLRFAVVTAAVPVLFL